jgi:alanine racemase
MSVTWAEIDAAALRNNIAQIKARLAVGSRLGVVVKSNAYGHGLEPCARIIVEAGADWLIVNNAAEALAVRRLGLEVPLYICGPTFAEEAATVLEAKASLVLYDAQMVAALQAAAQASGHIAKVHIKIETGTNRQGLNLTAAIDLARLIDSCSNVELEGITTHFADIEDSTDHTFAQTQLDALLAARAAFEVAGIGLAICHSANSAATLLWPETHLDLVRVGIAAYGMWPSRETYATALQRSVQHGLDQGSMPGDIKRNTGGGPIAELRPVLSWRARIAQVKEIAAGAFVGYGRTFKATHPMRLAVIPVGYYEGFDRRLSNVGHVLVNGVRAPVRGRVCMNMFMADVSDIGQVEAGAVATLLGRDGEEEIDASMWAQWMGAIHYEALARIQADMPRLVVEA